MELDRNLNFFDLPTEIRWKILGYVHAQETCRPNWTTWNDRRLVCRQMKNDIDNGFGVYVSWNSDCRHQQRDIPKLTSNICLVTMSCYSTWMQSFPSVLEFFRKNGQSIKELSWILHCQDVVLSELFHVTDTCPNLKKLYIKFGYFFYIKQEEVKTAPIRQLLLPKVTSLRLHSAELDVCNSYQVIFYLLRMFLLPNISQLELKMFGNKYHSDLILAAFRHLFGFLLKHSSSLKSLDFFIDVHRHSQNWNESNLKELSECVDSLKDKLFLRHMQVRLADDRAIVRHSILVNSIIKFVMQQAATLEELTFWSYEFPENVYFPNLRKFRLFLVRAYQGLDCNMIVNLFPNLQDLSIHGNWDIVFHLRNCRLLLQVKRLKRLFLYKLWLPVNERTQFKSFAHDLKVHFKFTVKSFIPWQRPIPGPDVQDSLLSLVAYRKCDSEDTL